MAYIKYHYFNVTFNATLANNPALGPYILTKFTENTSQQINVYDIFGINTAPGQYLPGSRARRSGRECCWRMRPSHSLV